ILAELLQPDTEDQVAWRDGQRYVPRLVHADLTPQQVTLTAEGAYLITGGLGRLGLRLAHWLADQGAQHLVLTSRRGLPTRDQWPELPQDGPAARQAAEVEALEARGVHVTVAAVDVRDERGMAA